MRPNLQPEQPRRSRWIAGWAATHRLMNMVVPLAVTTALRRIMPRWQRRMACGEAQRAAASLSPGAQGVRCCAARLAPPDAWSWLGACARASHSRGRPRPAWTAALRVMSGGSLRWRGASLAGRAGPGREAPCCPLRGWRARRSSARTNATLQLVGDVKSAAGDAEGLLGRAQGDVCAPDASLSDVRDTGAGQRHAPTQASSTLPGSALGGTAALEPDCCRRASA